MLDKGKLRNRVLLNLLTSPLTLVPFVLGTTMLAGALAFSNKLGALAFAGLACVLGAVGTYVTRVLLGTEAQTAKVIEQMQREAQVARERRLDKLDKRLVRDRDARTQAALRDLRAFEQAFRARQTWARKLNATSAFDIVSSVQDLFDGCVQALETSLELYETARKLRTDEARQPILERREEIIQDVQSSIEQLSRIMVGIQSLGTETATDSDLARIRSELDQNLTVARRVEEKMRSWQEHSFEME